MSAALKIIDQARLAQFSAIGSRRNLLANCVTWQDATGSLCSGEWQHGHWVGITALGPSSYFYPHFEDCNPDKITKLISRPRSVQRIALEKAASSLGSGRLIEKLLFAIHWQVLAEQSSTVTLPDLILAEFIWGRRDGAKPRHWRGNLLASCQALTRLHVAEGPKNKRPDFNRDTALVVRVGDLKGCPEDQECDDRCPQRFGPRHHHFQVTIGHGFFGVLERFGQTDAETGVRLYDFQVGGTSSGQFPGTLRDVGRDGCLVSAYLPAKLGDPTACNAMTASQQRLLQAIVRETTRVPRKKRSAAGQAEEFVGNRVRDFSGRKESVCPILGPEQRHVGFNGNRKRKGMGYKLFTRGGWLAKAGYAIEDVDSFLRDLSALCERLGICAVGLSPRSEWFELSRLRALAACSPGRRQLGEIHLRIYAGADYLERWNKYFGWPLNNGDKRLSDDAARIGELAAALKIRKISLRELANGLGVNHSFLSRAMRGIKPWPSELLDRAFAWAISKQTARSAKQLPRIPKNPSGSMLEVALALLERGWSVVPQLPEAKKPRVRWKRFQERPPTKEDLQGWYQNWPDAGIALILGPTSGVFVIDVDGSEAHQALLDRLKTEPWCPKALSGSREPDRYHLFFRHPDLPTKPKTTPWHPKLEFRGDKGIVVIPPSRHKSGNEYAWEAGRSPDDLELPPLPKAVLAAIEPAATASNRREGQIAARKVGRRFQAASGTTLAFLGGKHAEGPGWNDRLFRAACDLQARGIPLAEAEPELLAGACPWNQGEEELALRTIASAYSQERVPSRY